jgi:hypothetical protein
VRVESPKVGKSESPEDRKWEVDFLFFDLGLKTFDLLCRAGTLGTLGTLGTAADFSSKMIKKGGF